MFTNVATQIAEAGALVRVICAKIQRIEELLEEQASQTRLILRHLEALDK